MSVGRMGLIVSKMVSSRQLSRFWVPFRGKQSLDFGFGDLDPGF